MSTQLDASIGFKKESVFGTGVVVDRFLEFTDETIDFERTLYQGAGLRPGSRVARSRRRVLTQDGASGDIGLEVPTKGLGAFLELLFGVASSTAVPDTDATYQQVFKLIKSHYLPSATIQKGVPRLGTDTVDAFTLIGAQCSNFELSLAGADVLKLKSSWTAKKLLTDVAYATPSYPSAFDLFSFVGASLVIGGSVVAPTATALSSGGTAVGDVKDFTLTVDQALDDGGHNIGGAGTRTRPATVGLAAVTGKMTVEYDAQTMVNALRDQTPLALRIDFVGPVEIETGQLPTLQIVVPELKFDGEMPKTNGGDVVAQAMDFTVLDNLTAAEPLYLVMRTADTAL